MGSFEMKKQAKNGLQTRSGCHELSWPVMVLWMTVKDDGHGRLSWILHTDQLRTDIHWYLLCRYRD